MLEPVTIYFPGSYKRKIDAIAYRQRILKDPNMLDKNQLMRYGNEIFKSTDNIIDLTQISENIEPSGAFAQLENFIPLEVDKVDFYMTIVPHNGVRALRRGYYKLLSIPEKTSNSGIENWRAEVLYNGGPNYKEVYKYLCNIGPLFNSFAVIGNLRSNEIFNHNKQIEKKRLFSSIMDDMIYVSSSELVINSDFNSQSKEVLWFL